MNKLVRARIKSQLPSSSQTSLTAELIEAGRYPANVAQQLSPWHSGVVGLDLATRDGWPNCDNDLHTSADKPSSCCRTSASQS